MIIAAFHPQIVHFVVALLIVGVVLRLVALTGRVRWAGPAATTLILLGTAAAVMAVVSGDQAQGPVERIPGADPLLLEHQELGARTRNLFLIVAVLEVLTLVGAVERFRRPIAWVSAAVGLVGLLVLYETAEHGGELVYAYAGGVGTRSGDPEDLDRLLLAGLYHRGMADRDAGRAADAGRLFAEMGRRFGDEDPLVQLLAIESLVRDQERPDSALRLLEAFDPPPAHRLRKAWYQADAWEALDRPDSALAVLEAATAFSNDGFLLARIERLRP